MIKKLITVMLLIVPSVAMAQGRYRYDPYFGVWSYHYPPQGPYTGQGGYYNESWAYPRYHFGPYTGEVEHGFPVRRPYIIDCYYEPWRCR